LLHDRKAGPAGIAKIKITYRAKYSASFCREGEIMSIPYAMSIHLERRKKYSKLNRGKVILQEDKIFDIVAWE
jgi:hypothetical protein